MQENYVPYTTTVVFDLCQVKFLTALGLKIRRNKDTVLSRSGILRALCDGLAQSRLDVEHVTNELELAQAVARQLAANGHGRAKGATAR
jgi:hypothetical protein